MSPLTRRSFLAVTGATTAVAGSLWLGSYAAAAPSRPPALPAGLVTESPDGWRLSNDVLTVTVVADPEGIRLTSIINTETGTEMLGSDGGRELFSYVFDGTHRVGGSDAGWAVVSTDRTDLLLHLPAASSAIGERLSITLARAEPVAVTVVVHLEIYAGRSGLRFLTDVRNDSEATMAITESTVLALPFAEEPHTLYYPPNGRWRSTRGGLSPEPEDSSSSGRRAERAKKVIAVLDSGEGWSLSPELNWKTMKGKGGESEYMLPPFASINVWHEIDHVHVATNPESLQLTLRPGEQFEYLSVNLTVFNGGLVEAKVAEQEHFRKRFRYHDVSTLFNTNDWDYRGGIGEVLPPDYYYDVIIPQAKRAGLDMVMLDDLWNTTRDTIVPNEPMRLAIRSLEEFSETVRNEGMILGLWFSLSGGGHSQGRDLADPAQLAAKREQIESLIGDVGMSHQMIDLTEYWQNPEITDYSHPADNVYRKNVLARRMLNELVDAYPHYLPKITSELDIHPTQGDRNNGLLHVAYNGWTTANAGVTGENQSLLTAWVHYGHLPAEAAYMNGGRMTGRMEDYYSFMAARNVKFAEDPGDLERWPAVAVDLMATFNRWRHGARVRALTDEIMRPVYLGTGWEGPGWNISAGPYVWMYCDEQRDRALLIATGQMGYAAAVVADIRWLADEATYAVIDITIDDDGSQQHSFRGAHTGASLRQPGFPIDLRENSSRGKAFWFERVTGDNLQVSYANEEIDEIEVDLATQTRIRLTVTGTPHGTGMVVVVDPTTNRGASFEVPLNARGRGNLVVQAARLRPPRPVATVFAETTYHEAELLTHETTAPSWRRVDEADASNRSWVLAEMSAPGQRIDYTVEVDRPGHYLLEARYKENESRGRSQLQIDGQPFGAPVNHFYTVDMYRGIEFRERYHGPVELAAGTHTFSLVGMGTSGGSHALGLDYLSLTPSLRLGRVVHEAEEVASRASASTRAVSDPAASPANGGQWHELAASGPGDWVEYLVEVPSAGRYRIGSVVKQHKARGIAQLLVEGEPLGGPVDQYLPPSDGAYRYLESDHGVVEIAAAGPVTLRFEVVGKNAGASAHKLAVDYLSIEPEPGLRVAPEIEVPMGGAATIDVEHVSAAATYARPEYLLWRTAEEEDIVDVDQAGVLTGVRQGVTTVTVTSMIDPEVQAQVSVRVS